jgi:hypothetical protein
MTANITGALSRPWMFLQRRQYLHINIQLKQSLELERSGGFADDLQMPCDAEIFSAEIGTRFVTKGRKNPDGKNLPEMWIFSPYFMYLERTESVTK